MNECPQLINMGLSRHIVSENKDIIVGNRLLKMEKSQTNGPYFQNTDVKALFGGRPLTLHHKMTQVCSPAGEAGIHGEDQPLWFSERSRFR